MEKSTGERRKKICIIESKAYVEEHETATNIVGLMAKHKPKISLLLHTLFWLCDPVVVFFAHMSAVREYSLYAESTIL